MYERSSKRPPNWRGGVVGQNENSCISEVRLWVMRDLSFLSKAGNSGWLAIEWRDAW